MNSGLWQPGQSGNPKGRPKSGKTLTDQLHKAIRKVQREKKRNLLEHFIKEAFEDNKVLVALMKKILPDMKSSQITGADGGPVQFRAWTPEQQEILAEIGRKMASGSPEGLDTKSDA